MHGHGERCTGHRTRRGRTRLARNGLGSGDYDRSAGFSIGRPRIAALRQTHPDLQIDLTVGVRSLDIARRESDLAIRFARPAASELVCRKLGEVGFSLYASQRYLAKSGIPKRGQGLGGYDLIAFTRAPAATSPFFMGESLDGARVAVRCDNPLIQLKAAANEAGIAELACFLGDSSPDLVRIWPDEPPARRTAWLVIHQDMRRSARIRVVSASIGEAFRRQRKTLEQGSRDRSGPFDTAKAAAATSQDARVSNS